MIERNKIMFSRMEEYVFFILIIFCPSGELMVVLFLCMLSVCIFRCFSRDFVSPQTQLLFEFSQATPGWCQQGLSAGGKVIRTPAMGKQTASPDCHVPSGSMLRDNSVA